jgi:hypothetical protein
MSQITKEKRIMNNEEIREEIDSLVEWLNESGIAITYSEYLIGYTDKSTGKDVTEMTYSIKKPEPQDCRLCFKSRADAMFALKIIGDYLTMDAEPPYHQDSFIGPMVTREIPQKKE